MKPVVISDTISYIPCSEEPLSADIGIIQRESGPWLFDVGCGERAIEGLTGEYHVVLSHFHRDHTENLDRLSVRNLYVSGQTARHVGRGILVDRDIYVDGLHIFPLPSSHCKGCLGLEADGTYAFVGDALYSRSEDGYYVFNVQQLEAQIRVLKNLKAPWLLASHFAGMLRPRQEVLRELESLYASREKDSTLIRIRR